MVTKLEAILHAAEVALEEITPQRIAADLIMASRIAANEGPDSEALDDLWHRYLNLLNGFISGWRMDLIEKDEDS